MPAIPEKFAVSVVMESRPSKNKWQETSWNAVGVCSVSRDSQQEPEETAERTMRQGDKVQIIYSPLTLRLYRDECESYYHNLMSPHPGCFVIAREDDSGSPVPFLVSMSFDEVHAYQEGDDLIYAVPIPPELYRWVETYIVEHYAPEKRKKRKRKNWKEGE